MARQSPQRETKSYGVVQARVQERRARGPHLNESDEQSSQLSSPNGYRESPEAANFPGSAAHSKVSFESSLASPSPLRAQFSVDSSQLSSPLRETAASTPPSQWPSVRSSLTVPPSSSDIGLDHNAW